MRKGNDVCGISVETGRAVANPPPKRTTHTPQMPQDWALLVETDRQ